MIEEKTRREEWADQGGDEQWRQCKGKRQRKRANDSDAGTMMRGKRNPDLTSEEHGARCYIEDTSDSVRGDGMGISVLVMSGYIQIQEQEEPRKKIE